MDQIVCSNCAAPLAPGANFCGSCGSAKKGAKTAAPRPGRWLAVAAIFAAAALLVAADKFRVFDDFVSRFNPALVAPRPQLSVEIAMPPGFNPVPNQGYIKITNLSEEPVKLISVSINHRKDAECSFGLNGSPLDAKQILHQGENTMVGSGSTLFGQCGTIVSVVVQTDKGSSEYRLDK
jgi:hypothetical protein